MMTTNIFENNLPIRQNQASSFSMPRLVPQISAQGPKYFCVKCGNGLGGMFSDCYADGCGWSSRTQKYSTMCAILECKDVMDKLQLSEMCEWSPAYRDRNGISRRDIMYLPLRECLEDKLHKLTSDERKRLLSLYDKSIYEIYK